MIDLIKEWSDLLISSGLGLTLLLYLKKILEAKKLRKQLKESIDDKQSKQIQILIKNVKKESEEHTLLMKKITFIYDNTKNGILRQQIELELKKQLATFISINNVTDVHIIMLLNNIIEGYLLVINDILLYNFNINSIELHKLIKKYITDSLYMINIDHMKLISTDFIQKIKENVFEEVFNSLILEYSHLRELENGERRSKFTETIINYNSKIVNKIIHYHKHKK